MKVQELLEMAKAHEFTSGAAKRKSASKLASEFKRGKGTFELSDGRVFKGAGIIGPARLKKGDITLASHNKYNQGAQLYQVLGFTKGNKESGSRDETPYFNSAQEALDAFDADSLEDLESNPTADVRLVVKDLEDGTSGAWFYIHNGEWSYGSGAEPLTFTFAREVEPGTK